QCDLRSGADAGFGGKQSGIRLELRNRRGGNREANLAFLWLVGNATRVHSVQCEIVVIAAVAGETNASLVGGTGIDSPPNQGEHTGPIRAIQGELVDLLAL